MKVVVHFGQDVPTYEHPLVVKYITDSEILSFTEDVYDYREKDVCTGKGAVEFLSKLVDEVQENLPEGCYLLEAMMFTFEGVVHHNPMYEGGE